jgi:hypothetical protein
LFGLSPFPEPCRFVGVTITEVRTYEVKSSTFNTSVSLGFYFSFNFYSSLVSGELLSSLIFPSFFSISSKDVSLFSFDAIFLLIWSSFDNYLSLAPSDVFIKLNFFIIDIVFLWNLGCPYTTTTFFKLLIASGSIGTDTT